ncbi:MAG: hypothetical protein PHX83_06975 [Acidobacteriia bacterium]|nr:hypothetical protein [Terriglobia bacterium]
MAQSKQRNRDEQDEDRPNLSVVRDKDDEEPEFIEKPKKRVKLGTFADIWPKAGQ